MGCRPAVRRLVATINSLTLVVMVGDAGSDCSKEKNPSSISSWPFGIELNCCVNVRFARFPITPGGLPKISQPFTPCGVIVAWKKKETQVTVQCCRADKDKVLVASWLELVNNCSQGGLDDKQIHGTPIRTHCFLNLLL
jgi:hypothetical protein